MDPEGSPFREDIDLVPPSPPANASFDFVNDPNVAHTPSYAGSYNNSPYSVHSELSFDGDDNPTNFGLFTSGGPQSTSYDPSEYDNPGSSLLMFNDTDYMSSYDPQVSMIHQSAPYGDYSSPSSSNGGGDSGNEGNKDPRSRASSVSSNHHHHLSPSPHLPPQHLTPSPRMAVAQSFEGMSFQSPSWPTESLPIDNHSPRQAQFSPNSRSISPNHIGMQQKPQSPPRLLMPDTDEGFARPPQINAPEGDGRDGLSGPSLRIVPATPISGGGANEGPGLPFRNGPALTPGYHQPPQRHHSLSPAPTDSMEFNHPSSSSSSSTAHPATASSSSQLTGSSSPNPKNNSAFLFPQGAPRTTRSKSDGALEPPTWDTAPSNLLGTESAIMDDSPPPPGGVSMNDVSPSTPPPHQRRGGMNSQFTFGGASNGGAPANNNYLSPDNGSLRRSKSDGYGRAPGHVRQSRSEDYRFGIPGINVSDGQDTSNGENNGLLFPPTSHDDFVRQQQQLRSQQFLSPSDGPMRPMSAGHGHSFSYSGQPSNVELGLAGSQLPNLGAGLGLTHLGPHNNQGRRPASSLGHIRRASSGTRSERGASKGWDDVDGPIANSVRASPYPSPNVSPRGRFGELPPPSSDFGTHQRSQSDSGGGPLLPSQGLPPPNMIFAGGPDMGVPPSMPGYGNGMGPGPMGYGLGGVPTGPIGPNGMPVQAAVTVGGTTVPLAVTKMTVTTGRTARASHNRRKQEATFHCPVPGCGSTFTRSFNLKGHIRSHNEEKPFVCHWPGCGKGFARQHDCKRHEQLHTNYRPFTCEGCQKPFARMDALNRHLRSEGGAECQRTLEQNGTLPPGMGSSPPAENNKRNKDGPAKSLPIPITSSNGTKVEQSESQWKMEDTWSGGLGVAL